MNHHAFLRWLLLSMTAACTAQPGLGANAPSTKHVADVSSDQMRVDALSARLASIDGYELIIIGEDHLEPEAARTITHLCQHGWIRELYHERLHRDYLSQIKETAPSTRATAAPITAAQIKDQLLIPNAKGGAMIDTCLAHGIGIHGLEMPRRAFLELMQRYPHDVDTQNQLRDMSWIAHMKRQPLRGRAVMLVGSNHGKPLLEGLSPETSPNSTKLACSSKSQDVFES